MLRSKLNLGSTFFAGLAVVSLFFGGLVYWAGHAPLDSASIAQGHVAIEDNRKVVQHLEGGLIKQILVRNDDVVKKGDILIKMDQSQLASQKKILEGQVADFKRQLTIVGREIAAIEPLYKKGLAKRSRLNGLLSRKSEIGGELTKASEQLEIVLKSFARTIIRAPIAGAIVGLQVHTVGAVIKSGDTLMSIVPSGAKLLIEVKISVLDIDVVYAGLPARIRLTSYNQRSVVPIEGKVTSISADRIIDDRTGNPYYMAQIEITKNDNKGIQLFPGMPTEVFIITGERTALDYFIEPFLRSFGRAFREE